MEKILNSYDKECMKMAMLKHEETFREQVYELHRLYKIQKLLMKKTEYEKQVQEQSRLNLGNFLSSNPVNDQHKRQRLSLDLERLAEEEHVEDDQTELELTLGPTSQCRRKRILNNTSDSAASFSSSSSTVSNRIMSSNSGSDQRINTSNESLKLRNWSSQMPGSKPVLLKDGSEAEEQLRQNRHGNPSWLFQALTLNTTRKNHLQPV